MLDVVCMFHDLIMFFAFRAPTDAANLGAPYQAFLALTHSFRFSPAHFQILGLVEVSLPLGYSPAYLLRLGNRHKPSVQLFWSKLCACLVSARQLPYVTSSPQFLVLGHRLGLISIGRSVWYRRTRLVVKLDRWEKASTALLVWFPPPSILSNFLGRGIGMRWPP